MSSYVQLTSVDVLILQGTVIPLELSAMDSFYPHLEHYEQQDRGGIDNWIHAGAFECRTLRRTGEPKAVLHTVLQVQYGQRLPS